jgi:hypothetical protein
VENLDTSLCFLVVNQQLLKIGEPLHGNAGEAPLMKELLFEPAEEPLDLPHSDKKKLDAPRFVQISGNAGTTHSQKRQCSSA